MAPRIDAERNRQALLDSAARLFGEHGPDVALDVVARDAGVSIATLYRNFTGRDDLLVATFQHEISALGEVDPLLEGHDAAAAMTAWVARFVEYARTKRAISEVLHSLPASGRPSARATVIAALEQLIAAGARDGTLRVDLDAEDVLHSLAGLWTIPDGPELDARTERLGRFVVEGLRAR